MVSAIGIRGPNSPLVTKFVVPSHNPIQLAAISNYKLAQLTFAPPDLHSLRKTAVIKNMLEDVYSNTPTEWLQQMTRWQYFTPESLEEMTQEGLEEIFGQYAQTIEAFRPIKSMTNYPDEDFYDDDDGQGDDLWIAEDEHITLPPSISETENDIPVFYEIEQPYKDQSSEQLSKSKTNSIESINSSLFSQPNATISSESINKFPSPVTEKPWSSNSTTKDDPKQVKRKSILGTNKNRLSWTSDTGITSSAVSQNLANELMNLFDMDFAVDINLNTAPKLPELSFKPKRKSLQRQSQDMLSTLLPEFEKIAFESLFDKELSLGINGKEKVPITKPPVPIHGNTNNPSPIVKSLPQRSSSLRHRQALQLETTKSHSSIPSPVTPPLTPDTPVEKTLSKKTSILRLASLVTGKKHSHKDQKDFPLSPEASPTSIGDIIQRHESSIAQQGIKNTPRKTSTSTVDTMLSTGSSSSWSSMSEVGGDLKISTVVKPLPDIPSDSIKQEKAVSYKTRHSSKKKKRTSVMEKTSMKRKSNNGLQFIYDPPTTSLDLNDPTLNRSKSTFIKIGQGLKSKNKSKQIRRTSSNKNMSDYEKQFYPVENNPYKVQSTDTINSVDTHHSFVKKVSLFNWRMKSRNKVVEV